MTPLSAPMSPRPRSCQPGCSATLTPASCSTAESHVSENAISASPFEHGRQLVILRRRDAVEVEIAAIDPVFRMLLGARGDPARSRRQRGIFGPLGFGDGEVAHAVVDQLVLAAACGFACMMG